jgi:RNA polymerase sigma-70 factor (ECF subfamily)
VLRAEEEARARRGDVDLMLAAQRGSKSAFVELYDRHKQRLMDFALRMTGRNPHLAADVVQQVFLYVLQHLRSYRPSGSPVAYLYRIARSLCLDEMKRQRKRRLDSLGAPPDWEGLASDSDQGHALAAAAEERVALRRAVDQLPPHLREVLVLRFYQGMSYEEIGRVVGCPPSTATSRMDYALKRLRKALGARAGLKSLTAGGLPAIEPA